MAPMEPWQRVWIDAETYAEDIHSLINCTTCHLGQAVDEFGQPMDDMDCAHEGMLNSPSEMVETTCGSCHPFITAAAANSLHSTLAGYDTVLHERSVPENHPILEEMQSYHCDSCHASCGDCHVSQPASVGGGLVDGHNFLRTPSMTQNCTACHGSRVQNEYFGRNEGIPSDVHFRARMSCVSCHTGDQIHGMTAASFNAQHRYDGVPEPSCESCHVDQVGVGSGIEQHEVHGLDSLSCQACHSTTYTNCVNCHVERNEEDLAYYTVEDHFMAFYIGRNPMRSAARPYAYVPLRHVPADINAFSFYGDDLLPNFDALPTWAYATPHNIQRNTPQTASCTSCHENATFFLTADKVNPLQLNANASVIVPNPPRLPAGYLADVAPSDEAAPRGGDSGGDDFWGDSSPPSPTSPDDSGDDFWGSDGDSAPAPSDESDSNDDDFWGGN